MDDIAFILTRFFQLCFSLNDASDPANSVFVKRLALYIVSDPLILAVIAMFFVGFVVSIFVRLYHSS